MAAGWRIEGDVPVALVDAPHPDRCALQLIFRVGIADEGWTTRGVSHVLTHVLLQTLEESANPHEYSHVGLLHTRFVRFGQRAEITNFLASLSSAITDPNFAGLEAARRTVRLEPRSAATGAAPLLAQRFGLRGVGAAHLADLGAYSLTEDTLRGWLQRFFHRDNLAIALVGYGDMVSTLSIPRGQRQAVPVLPEALGPVPGWNKVHGAQLAASMVAPRGAESRRALFSARAYLERNLIREAGFGSALTAHYDPIDQHTAHAALLLSTSPEIAGDATTAFLDGMSTLANDSSVLAVMSSGEAQAGLMDDAPGAEVQKQWAAAVDGAEVAAIAGAQSQPDIPEDQRGVEGIAEAWRSMYELRVFWVSPRTASLPGLEEWHLPDRRELKGKTFYLLSARSSQRLWRVPIDWITVGLEGVNFRRARQHPLTISFDACAGAIVTDDGDVTFLGINGSSLRLQPAFYRHGDEMRALIVGAVGPGRVVAAPAEPQMVAGKADRMELVHGRRSIRRFDFAAVAGFVLLLLGASIVVTPQKGGIGLGIGEMVVGAAMLAVGIIGMIGQRARIVRPPEG